MEQTQNPGLSPAVQAAMQRRSGGNMQAGQGQLTQVSAQAPMQQPTPQMPPASDANKSSAPQVTATPKYTPQNQQDMIVEALIEQLHNSTKLEKEKMKMASPSEGQPSMGAVPVAQTAQAQSVPPQPALMGMGGGGMSDPNFLRPLNNPSSSTAFDFGAPSMANTSKQNPYSF